MHSTITLVLQFLIDIALNNAMTSIQTDSEEDNTGVQAGDRIIYGKRLFSMYINRELPSGESILQNSIGYRLKWTPVLAVDRPKQTVWSVGLNRPTTRLQDLV
jgi:hypothetical protein